MVPLAVSRPSSTSLIGTMQIVFLVVFCLLRVVYGDGDDTDDEFCSIGDSMDLTYAQKNASGFLTESGYFFPRELATRFGDSIWRGCICDLKPCLQLCPRRKMNGIKVTDLADELTNLYSAIPSVHTTNLTIDDAGTLTPEKRFNLITRNPCPGKTAYFLDPRSYELDEFYLLKNGSLFLPRRNGMGMEFLDSKQYCLELQLSTDPSYTPKVCASEDKTDDPGRVKYFGALVSVPFCIATLIVYSVLKELRNIYVSTFRCYLCCLILTYVTLAADRIPPPDLSASTVCLCLGFTIYFSFLATFSWLNVMCINMWRRFGDYETLGFSSTKHDCKTFIGYSLYAWGNAFISTAICIGMEFAPGIPEWLIRPDFRLNACWFNTKTAAAFYFFGPISLIIVFNICLFVSTSIKLIQYERTKRQLECADSRRHTENKQWFGLNLKLFVVMVISWSTELISWLWEDPEYFLYVTEVANALQGILIFVIFVCTKNVRRLLRARLCGSNSPPTSVSDILISGDNHRLRHPITLTDTPVVISNRYVYH